MLNGFKFAREKNIPYFGICLGMQVAVIEFARNVLKLDADSTEFRDISSVEVHQSKDQVVELLFDEDHSFDERILNEQFKF